jgi:hypothetical protein
VQGLEGAIYREVAGIRESDADEIPARIRATGGRVAGYNLNELSRTTSSRSAWSSSPAIQVGSGGDAYQSEVSVKRATTRARTITDVIQPRGVA